MPRKKSRKISNRGSMKSDTEPVDSNLGETFVVSTDNDLAKIEMEIEEKFQEFLEELEAKKRLILANLEFSFNSLILSVPESVLNQRVDMSDESLRIIFEYVFSQINGSESSENTTKVHTAAKRRRSRSATEREPIVTGVKRINIRESKRSSSLDVFKTPRNKVWLQALTSVKKYTVSKPPKVEDSAISVKRIMKPDEEAISITGSPLLVQPSLATAPTINIPLPGGIVMNILPKRPRGDFAVPDFDEKTKEQLKMLSQQLKSLF